MDSGGGSRAAREGKAKEQMDAIRLSATLILSHFRYRDSGLQSREDRSQMEKGELEGWGGARRAWRAELRSIISVRWSLQIHPVPLGFKATPVHSCPPAYTQPYPFIALSREREDVNARRLS